MSLSLVKKCTRRKLANDYTSLLDVHCLRTYPQHLNHNCRNEVLDINNFSRNSLDYPCTNFCDRRRKVVSWSK